MRQRSDHEEVWRRYLGGETPAQISRAINRKQGSVWQVIYKAGGIRPAPRCRAPGRLSLDEREEVSRGLAAGHFLRGVARRLGRAPSTISREVARNGGRGGYRAHRADGQAWQTARRPKRCKLAANGELARLVGEQAGPAVVP